MTYCRNKYIIELLSGIFNGEFIKFDDIYQEKMFLYELISQCFSNWCENPLIDRKMIETWNHLKQVDPNILDSRSIDVCGGVTPKQYLFSKDHCHDYIRCRENLRQFFRENGIRLPDPTVPYHSIKDIRDSWKIGEISSKWDDNAEPHDWIDDLQREWKIMDINNFKRLFRKLNSETLIKLRKRYYCPFINEFNLSRDDFSKWFNYDYYKDMMEKYDTVHKDVEKILENMKIDDKLDLERCMKKLKV